MSVSSNGNQSGGMVNHNPDEPGQFDLYFRNQNVQYGYWILDLGPLDSQGLYSYAITSDPTGELMWVLARNVTEFFALYDEEVHVKLEELGFKEGSREPVVTYQGSDCEYEDVIPVNPVDELHVDKYMGMWFEMYTDNFVGESFENNTFCQQKNYALREGGERISVHNYHTIGAPDGDTSTMTGKQRSYCWNQSLTSHNMDMYPDGGLVV